MAFLVGLIATAVAVPLVIYLSPRMRMLDEPGSDVLKIHRRPIPRSGGLALALGMAFSLLAVKPGSVWLVGGAGALAIGLVDDRIALSPRLRIVAEVILAGIVSTLLVGTGNWPRVLLGVVLISVAINAINMFDGLDGLLPGAGALSAVGFALLLTGSSASWMWALAGGLLGFLIYNRPPARIFLGDGGAYFAGLTLGMGLLEASASRTAFLGGSLIFGLVAIDFALTVIRRARNRRPLFLGDRSHLYDQLLDRGWQVWHILGLAWSLQAGLVALGLVVAGMSLTFAVIVVGTTLVLALLCLSHLGFIRPDAASQAR